MNKNKAVLVALAFSLLFLTGCSEHKCIDGKIYHQLDKNVWAESGLWHGTKCISEVTK